MAKLVLEYWPVGRLASAGRRLKKHEAASVRKMIDSIREYGFRVPVLATADGEILDGELRLLAAMDMGLDEVPVLPADDLTPAQVRAFRMLLLASPAWSAWDFEAVARELEAVVALDVDVRLAGLDPGEARRLLAAFGSESGGQGDPDAAPPLPEVPVSRPGDLFALGAHRLLCGDATRPADLDRLMAGERADMVFVDPPYNVDYKGKAGKIKNDHMADAAFLEFLRAAFSALHGVMAEGAPIYVAHADREGHNFHVAFRLAGFKMASLLIWRKNVIVLGRSDYQSQHEPILYGWKPGAAHAWYGGRNKATVQECGDEAVVMGDGACLVTLDNRVLVITGENLIVESRLGSVVCEPKPKASDEHPTMKPVGLLQRFLRNSSAPGDLVVDTFGGSGSTLIACETLGRRARLCELDPRFVDVIVRRWQTFAGREAVLADTGATFAAIARERA